MLQADDTYCKHNCDVLQCFNEDALAFQLRIGTRSGLGEETYLPSGKQNEPVLLLMPYSCNSD